MTWFWITLGIAAFAGNAYFGWKAQEPQKHYILDI